MATLPPPPQLARPMAPPPQGEPEPPTRTTAEASKSVPAPFLTKTFQLVDDPAIDDIISWNEDGSAFVVWRPAEFARDLLPKYFKHSNFSSFVRQLNTYGFRKIVTDRWEFANEYFKRGEKKLLCDIHRRKIAAPMPSAQAIAAANNSPANSGEELFLLSNLSPGAASSTSSRFKTYLTDENDRLRKENVSLKRELSQLKGLCNNIFVLMSDYAAGQFRDRSGDDEEDEHQLPPAQQPLQLKSVYSSELDQDPKGAVPEDSERPRLFGVEIGSKRVREKEGFETVNDESGYGKSGAMDPDLPKGATEGRDDPDDPWLVMGSGASN